MIGVRNKYKNHKRQLTKIINIVFNILSRKINNINKKYIIKILYWIKVKYLQILKTMITKLSIIIIKIINKH